MAMFLIVGDKILSTTAPALIPITPQSFQDILTTQINGAINLPVHSFMTEKLGRAPGSRSFQANIFLTNTKTDY